MNQRTLVAIAAEQGVRVEQLSIQKINNCIPAVYFCDVYSTRSVCSLDSIYWQEHQANAFAVWVIDNAKRRAGRKNASL